MQTKIKKSDPKKDEKFETWNLESIDDSPFSLWERRRYSVGK